MSWEDLENLVRKTDVEPPIVIEPTSINELVGKRDNIEAISAQRDVEERFNNPLDFDVPWLNSQSPAGPFLAPEDPESLEISSGRDVLRDAREIGFVMGYPSRLLRSALALSGVSATADRFKDIKKSQSFWTAMLDVTRTIQSISPQSVTSPDLGAVRDIGERATEQIKEIPGLLTDPDVPENIIPGIGNVLTVPLEHPERIEWMFDLVGELAIENSAISGSKVIAKKGWAKLTKQAYDNSDELVKKGGVARLLGQLDDDEMKAVGEAVEFRKVGKLGTKPLQLEINDSVKRTFDYIAESKPSQLVKKQTISSKRKAAAAQMYAIQGDGYGPGYAARLRKAGTITATNKDYTPLLEVSDKAWDDLTVLQRTVDNHDFGASKIYTTGNVQDSLEKLYTHGTLLTPGEVEGLRDVFGDSFANKLFKVTDKPTGIAGKVFEGGSKLIQGLTATSRTLMTTGELSFLLRQANYRAWTRPRDAIRSWSVAGRSLISKRYADNVDDAIRFSRSGKVGTEHGLFLGRWRDAKKLTQREEVFMAEWLDKVPIIGNIKTRFERGYVNGLNQIRADWFDEGLQLLERSGRASDESLENWAAYVNNMTGRADIDNIATGNKGLAKMASVAKHTLFAPRFTASKWNRHKVAAELMFGRETPNSMRRLLASDAATKWRRYERLAHYYTQNGGSVETDIRSSDFLKLNDGSTRIGVLGGDTQIQVMLARLVTGQTKDTATGLLKDKAALELASQYISGKLNPLYSLIFDKLIAKQTFEGEDINDPEVLAKVIREKFIPLYSGDIKDKIFNEYEQQGGEVAGAIQKSIPVIALGFGGATIQTFEPSARKQYELMIDDKAVELHAKHFDDLPIYLKQEVTFEAENDDIDKTELLKEEMGMNRPSPGTSSRLTTIKNKSFRAIRKGLGNDYNLFRESNIPVREFPIDIGDVRLSTEQHNKLSKLYVKFIKQEIKQYPEMSDMPPLDYERRMWLKDIESFARQDAIEELIFSEE
ncbi:MAG: hypothetical protein V3V88_02940 [Dehalococcoidia bacterium]